MIVPPLVILGLFPAALGGGATLVLHELNLLSLRKSVAVGIIVACWIFLRGIAALRVLYGPNTTHVISPENYVWRMCRAYLLVPVAVISTYLVCRILHFETPWPAILVLAGAIHTAHNRWSY